MTRRRFLAVAGAIVVAGLVARILVGAAKTDFHVDEGITLAITNGSWKPPVVAPVFDRWMDKEELEELAFNANLRSTRRIDATGIARTTAGDVHPPLFYWLFALARLAVGVGRHVAAALLLNGLCFVATAALVCLAVVRANRGGVDAGRKVALLALAIFSFSSVSVALTPFMRMYELLQTACLAFACLASLVVCRPDGAPSARDRVVPIACLSLAVCAGALTHYHFLFFALSVVLVCFFVLLARLELSELLWSALSCAVGLYAALAIFPEIRLHLIGSDRAREGISFASGVFSGGTGPALSRASGYLLLAFRHVPALAAALALVVSLAVARLVSPSSRSGPNAEPRERASFPAAFLALFAVPCAALFAVVSVTAPFRSLRYIAPCVPALSVALACALTRLWDAFRSRRARSAAVALSLLVSASSLPRAMPTFHDEYATDRDPEYFRDGAPVIIVSDRQGFAWKNMLPYLSIPDHKRVYVTMRYEGGDFAPSLAEVVRDSGDDAAYAMVDVLFPAQPSMERVGSYGFFAVYRIAGRHE